MELRDYQQDLFARVLYAFPQRRRVMLQLPTGGGKTVIFSAIVHTIVRAGRGVLILAHRTELIEQAAEKLAAIAPDIQLGIIKAGIKPNYHAPIQVASVQSLKRRLHHLDPEKFGLVIVDEAHHSTAATYRHVLDHFPNSYQLGVTATPIRTKGEGFADLFDEMVTGITVRELIDQGYLSPYKLYAAPNSMTTQGARVTKGDYSARDVAELNPVTNLAVDLLQSYREHANGSSCIVFAVNIEHSKIIAAKYAAEGIPARHLDGTTSKDERNEVLDLFRRGEVKVISNVGLFTEGLDVPNLQTVQLARPTKSLSLYLQMVGRALRICEGKEHAIILDHTKNYLNHGLPSQRRSWTLLGVEEEDRPELERQSDGLIVPHERPTITITKKPASLVEVEIEPNQEESFAFWNSWLKDKIAQIEVFQYNKYWLFHQAVKDKPPLETWQAIGEYLGYKKGWGWHQYNKHSVATRDRPILKASYAC